MTDDTAAKAGTTVTAEGRHLTTVTLIYAALTFVMAYPFSAHPGTTVLADVPDTHLFLWTLAWDAYAFLHQPFQIFDANIYYPYANTLAYSENLIGSAFIAAPVIWATGNYILAMNLAALATCVLCGTGGYLLARRLKIGIGGAFLCGLVFAFAPPRFFRMGQLHMTAVQWIPFSLAFLHTYLDTGSKRDLRLAIACFSLQALSSGHGAMFLAVAILGLAAYRVALGEPLAVLQRLRDIGVSGAYLMAPAVWVMLPYRIAQDEAGLKRGFLAGSEPNFASFVASPSRFHMYLQSLYWNTSPNVEADAFLFPGLLLPLLALLALVPIGRRVDAAHGTLRERLRQNPILFYTLLALLCVLMFLPPPLGLWRFAYWLPVFNFTRVPSRFMILALLALAVVAGAGFERLFARVSQPRRLLAAAAIATLFLAEYSGYPFASVPYAVDIPAVDLWLETRPKPFVVAEVPVPSRGNWGALERQQTTAMIHAMAHWQKTIHGYSGIRRPLHDRVYEELTEFPDHVSLTRLRELGVDYVVVHTDGYTDDQWRAVQPLLERSSELRLEHSDGAGRVYAVLPAAAR